MKRISLILIIIVLVVSFVWSESISRDSHNKNKRKQYWAEGQVVVLGWKVRKDKVKISFTMKNKKGNIPIKSYKIKFCIVYEGGIKDYQSYSYIEEKFIAPGSKKVRKFEVPIKVNKKIENVMVEELNYELLDNKIWKKVKSFYFLLGSFLILGIVLMPHLIMH
ncbi:hypothetical protein KAU33_00860 [Candidatus Dependentiae bacterium]|nr:hypothetical protein [Candidatus Dependentiae bacterium]